MPEKKPGRRTRPGADQGPVTDEALLFVVAFGAVLAVAELAKERQQYLRPRVRDAERLDTELLLNLLRLELGARLREVCVDQ